MRTLLLSAFGVLLTLVNGAQAGRNEWTLELDLRGHRVEGLPVHWSDGQVRLMGRDGRLWEFASNEASNFRKKSQSFRPYTQSEMRNQLMREFGRGMEVSATGNYLVVHPPGQRKQWAKWFEDLHRSMIHYFTARRFSLHKPRFPLVALVLPNQQEFMRYSAQRGSPVSSAVLGYYHPTTNRIVQYDMSSGQQDARQVMETESTIIHEAAHQTAFNVGIHNRTAETPLWVVEGIATTFEAPGVWNARIHPKLSDRINRGRLGGYHRHFSDNRNAGALESLVTSDRLFTIDPDAAYACSWALMFYLAERETAKLARYIKLTALRPPNEGYSQAERLADFTRVFGPNLPMMERRLYRFIMSLQ